MIGMRWLINQGPGYVLAVAICVFIALKAWPDHCDAVDKMVESTEKSMKKIATSIEKVTDKIEVVVDDVDDSNKALDRLSDNLARVGDNMEHTNKLVVTALLKSHDARNTHNEDANE